MIYITGDTHGDVDFDKLLKLKEKNLSYEDYLIICGDAAICWSPFDLIRFLRIYNDIGCTILFVDGNHENFDMQGSRGCIPDPPGESGLVSRGSKGLHSPLESRRVSLGAH